MAQKGRDEVKDQERAWLELLRGKGPQSICVLFRDYPEATSCLERGWTVWSGRLEDGEAITPAGIAALKAMK